MLIHHIWFGVSQLMLRMPSSVCSLPLTLFMVLWLASLISQLAWSTTGLSICLLKWFANHHLVTSILKVHPARLSYYEHYSLYPSIAPGIPPHSVQSHSYISLPLYIDIYFFLYRIYMGTCDVDDPSTQLVSGHTEYHI